MQICAAKTVPCKSVLPKQSYTCHKHLTAHLLVQVIPPAFQLLQVLALHLGRLLGLGQLSIGSIYLARQRCLLRPAVGEDGIENNTWLH
jgi:hypothetical protein